MKHSPTEQTPRRSFRRIIFGDHDVVLYDRELPLEDLTEAEQARVREMLETPQIFARARGVKARRSDWASLGDPPEQRGHEGPGMAPLIESDARIEAFVTVDAGTSRTTYVGHRTWLMKHVHVGHDALIGDDCELAPHVSVGGHVMIGDRVRVGQGAIFKPGVTVGDDARIGMGAVVVDDVPAGEVWVGNPARKMGAARIEREAQDAAILNLRRDLDRLRSDLAAGELLDPGMGEYWREKNRALEQLLIVARDLVSGRTRVGSPADLRAAVDLVDAVRAPECRSGDHA